ncbi:MAG TPA: transposase [Beutenbergiaceae bacterium]|nr:transposase [Beutenbergiaceae bacterium]
MSSLTEIAAELYVRPRAEFVPVRDTRAKETADPELGAQIRALRKPSIAAWVVNVFAAERAEQLGQALGLAEELREAQEDLDTEALRELSRQRRALTDKLAKEAADLAAARGERVSDATLEAVQQTLTAAFFHPDAAAAVASGRLVRELQPTGDYPPTETIAGGAPSPAAPQRADELSARRQRRDAERRVRAAEQALERVAREQHKVDKEIKNSEERLQRLATEVTDLEAELKRARSQERAARGEFDKTAGSQEEARKRVAAAEADLEKARAALEELL